MSEVKNIFIILLIFFIFGDKAHSQNLEEEQIYWSEVYDCSKAHINTCIMVVSTCAYSNLNVEDYKGTVQCFKNATSCVDFILRKCEQRIKRQKDLKKNSALRRFLKE